MFTALLVANVCRHLVTVHWILSALRAHTPTVCARQSVLTRCLGLFRSLTLADQDVCCTTNCCIWNYKKNTCFGFVLVFILFILIYILFFHGCQFCTESILRLFTS